MNQTWDKIRIGCIYFFSSICVIYCLYTHAIYPPDAFADRGVYLSIAFILFYLIKLPKEKNQLSKIVFSLATLAGVFVSIYMMVEEPRIAEDYYRANTTDFYVFLIYAVAALIVITRMSGGKIVAGMALFGILYIFFGNYVPGLFGHPPFSHTQSTIMLLTDVDKGALGNLMGLMARLLSIFLIFAALLLATGLGDLINSVAAGFLGKLKGGPAKVAVISSMFFGMLSGSPVANVAATGAITIPLMKRIGYHPRTAGAIETLASTGGELVPPVMGLGAFVMSEILGISYTTICLWGIVPAILWYWTVYWMVHYSAWKQGIKTWTPPREETLRELKDKVHLSLALFAFVFFLIQTKIPETAVFWSIVFLFIVSMARKGTRLNLERMGKFFQQFASSFAGIALLLSLLGVFISSLTSTGFHVKLGMMIFGNIHQWFIVAALVFVLCIVFGMAVPVIAAYLSVVLIAAPVLVELGFSNSLVHMFVFYACCLAPITPPVAMAAYTASSISGADPMKTAMSATMMAFPLWIIPFLLLRYGFYVGMDTPLHIVVYWSILSLISCYVFVIGSVGYFKGVLNGQARIIAIGAALLGMQPLSSIVSLIATVAGLAFLVILSINKQAFRTPSPNAS